MFYIYSYHFGIIIFVFYPEAVVQRCPLKIIFKNFANFTRKHLCWSVFLSAAKDIFKMGTLAQLFFL